MLLKESQNIVKFISAYLLIIIDYKTFRFEYTLKIEQDRDKAMRRSEVTDVRTVSKCLMRQTDNSDNSTGDRIENSATEIT